MRLAGLRPGELVMSRLRITFTTAAMFVALAAIDT